MSAQLPQQRLTVPGDVDENDFYTLDNGKETLVTHADLEEAVDNNEKPHLKEIQRYWVNKPYAFVVIYRNIRDNELRYVVVEPRLTGLEDYLVSFFRDKLRTSLEYDSVDIDATPVERSRIVRDETIGLMKRYNLLSDPESKINDDQNVKEKIKQTVIQFLERQADKSDAEDSMQDSVPTPRNPETGETRSLNSTQVRRILYYLVRDYIRFDRLDPIKQDVNIEDISCDGYEMDVFVYHSEYGQQIVTNVSFGEKDLDNYVKTLAQTAGKGISRRQPSVDATLADGSRAQMTLGTETSDKGTNFTIRQFNEIPFTPVDLINWETFNIDQMAYLWLAIENNKSFVVSGGTASGKTTTLNAVSLFMPSTSKIVSIEDTRELEIPQANWIPRTTRESFQDDGAGSIDEFDLLEDALRQRPDYVIMGEVRGEEGQTLFQMLNTGHTTYTTFHADKPKEVIRRFTTDPINVSPSMFDALDMICQLESIDLGGSKVRRATEIVEINDYNASSNRFSMNDAFGWDRKKDRFRKKGKSNILENIKRENAWDEKELLKEWNRRRLVLAFLVQENINTYAGVAATLQGYMSSKETILALISDNKLRNRIAALHQMQTINIDTDPEKEALIPRPQTPNTVAEEVSEILRETESLLVGFDSNDVDFAQTIDTILTNDQLEPGEKQLLQGESGEFAGELPEAEDDTSIGVAGTSESPDAIDEQLENLFDDEESDEQLILTSENLKRLNDQGANEMSDIDSLFVDEEKNVSDNSNTEEDSTPIDAGGKDDEETENVDSVIEQLEEEAESELSDDELLSGEEHNRELSLDENQSDEGEKDNEDSEDDKDDESDEDGENEEIDEEENTTETDDNVEDDDSSQAEDQSETDDDTDSGKEGEK